MSLVPSFSTSRDNSHLLSPQTSQYCLPHLTHRWGSLPDSLGLKQVDFQTSSHPCLHLLCPPTTEKHRCCCINSQAPYLWARFHLISPRTWFQPSFPSPTSSVFLLLLAHLINQMPLFHLKIETKNLTLLLPSASTPLLCSYYSTTPHSSCVWFHSTKTAPIDSQWPSHWQTQFLSWLLTRPVSIIDTSDPFPLTDLCPLASNWPVITPFHFPTLVPLLSS